KVHRVEVGLHDGYSDYAKTGHLTAFGPPPAYLDYDRWLGPAPVAPYCAARVHKNWRWNMAYGGGRIMDWCGHHCDIAHWGLGLDRTGPISAEGTGVIPDRKGIWNSPTEYDVDCTYADGMVMNVSSKHPGGLKWIGDEGWIYVTRGKTEASDPKILEHVVGDDETRLYYSRNHIANFLECIRSREETITPAEVAHRSASVGHLCNAAIYSEQKVNWDPDAEVVSDNQVASDMMYPDYRKPWTL
ncbi:MAG: gfo/Idh/MocA family oxidoreductase, partial [Candidatus Hydrogenedentes bacterium]|nr:gfo/Idh/MocA family oxidoreductase [Candidatus Hydrogenedentota bacterium]